MSRRAPSEERRRWARWLAWCARQQAKYEAQRRKWREDHQDADVSALELQYGIEAELLSEAQLKAPALKMGGDEAAKA